MAQDAVVTVRIPAALKRELEERAAGNRRSLSAQVLFDLETTAGASARQARPGRFLGLFAGTPVPTDAQFAEVRRRLWKALRPRRRRD